MKPDATPTAIYHPNTIIRSNHIAAYSFRQAEAGIFTNGNLKTEGASYDTKARLYEFLVSTKWYNRFFWGTQPDDYSSFTKMALEESKGTIIDVGCGGLTHTAEVYSTIHNYMVLVDNSIEMLKIAKKRLESFQHVAPPNILLLQADAFNLPFHKEFDNLFSFGMLHLFDDKASYLNNILDTLKPGGRFYLSSLTTDRKISKKYMAALHKRNEMGAGMTSREIIQLFTAHSSALSSYCKGSMVFIKGIKSH